VGTEHYYSVCAGWVGGTVGIVLESDGGGDGLSSREGGGRKGEGIF
jgi:hypothetical protein